MCPEPHMGRLNHLQLGLNVARREQSFAMLMGFGNIMNNCTINVPESVTVRSVAAFRDRLLKACETGQEVVLDLADSVQPDLSFVQLVCAARSYLEQCGRTIRLSRPAGVGLTALLGRAGFLAAPHPADIEFWFHGDLP